MIKYPKLLSYLELFLSEPVLVYWRGEPIPSHISERISESWYNALSGQSLLQDSIRQIWSTASDLAKPFVELLSDRIQDLGVMESPTDAKVHGLLYVFQHQDSEEVSSWLGGVPGNEQDFILFKDKFGVPPPISYVDFSSIHNGFVKDGWSSLGLKPVQNIFAIGQPISNVRQSIMNESMPLLAFCGDGVGNERCYDLSSPTENGDFDTVDWDHETESSGAPMPFWDFLFVFCRREMA